MTAPKGRKKVTGCWLQKAAKPTNESSPALQRWELAVSQSESAKRTTEEIGALLNTLSCPYRTISAGHYIQAKVRTTRAGLPTAIARGGIERDTTAPAPIIEPSPTVTPLRMIARAPSQAPAPIATGAD